MRYLLCAISSSRLDVFFIYDSLIKLRTGYDNDINVVFTIEPSHNNTKILNPIPIAFGDTIDELKLKVIYLFI